MNGEHILKKFKKSFDAELERTLDLKIAEAKKISPWAVNFTKDLKDYMVEGGGKRARPSILYYTYLAGGGKNKKAILRASVCAELIHVAYLIQDDIIDRDNLRHGKDAMHYHCEKWALKNLRMDKANARHYGISQAICISDIALEMAFRALADSPFEEKAKIMAIQKLAEMAFDTAIGQMSDMLAENLDSINEKDVIKILNYKTALYTFFGPISIGAMFAGKPKKYIERLAAFAIPLGVAFQVEDDILGVFGSQEETGKPVGADIREGKKTLLIVKALELGNAGQKKELLEALGNPKISDRKIERARRIIAETGSLEYSKNLAQKLVAQSREAIEKSKFDSRSKKFFIELAEFIIKRKY